MEEHRVDHAEERDVRADPEPQADDRDEREPRRFPELTDGVAELEMQGRPPASFCLKASPYGTVGARGNEYTDDRSEPRSPRACRNDPNGHVVLAVAPGLHSREHQSGRSSGRRLEIRRRPRRRHAHQSARVAPLHADARELRYPHAERRRHVCADRTWARRSSRMRQGRRARRCSPWRARGCRQSFGEFEYSLETGKPGMDKVFGMGSLRLSRRASRRGRAVQRIDGRHSRRASRRPLPRRTTSRRSARSSMSAAPPATCWRTS